MAHRPLAVCALLLVIPLAVSAQAPNDVLAGVRARYRNLTRQGRTPRPRVMTDLLGELKVLEHAGPRLRERACQFAEKLTRRPMASAGEAWWRLEAVRLIAGLALKRSWVPALLKASRQRGKGTLRGLDHWVERALGRVRTRALATELLDAALSAEHPGQARLALGGLVHLEDTNLLAAVRDRLPRMMALARSEDAEVRARALRVLGRMALAQARPLVFAGATDREIIVRLAAARALGDLLQYPGAEMLLGRLLADEVARVREAAALALRAAPGTASVPLLVARMAREPLRQRFELSETLKVLTNLDFGPDALAWAAWLASTRAGGQSGPLRQPARQTGRPYDRPRTPARKKPTSFYGIPVRSDHVLFVMDVSGSMGFNVGTSSKAPNRLEQATQKLLAVLKALDERTFFNILFFSSGFGPWHRGGLLPATPEHRHAAVSFVKRQLARGGTNTYGALERAFKDYPSLDTIFFLSDGVPSQGRTTVTERILQAVWQWNRRRGVRIHTISLLGGQLLDPFRRAKEDKVEAEHLMRALAEVTGGQFVASR